MADVEAGDSSGLLERHIAFVEALRAAGLQVSLAEDLDAVRAVTHLPLLDRGAVRAGYAATLVKRETHRGNFDTIFDLYFPPLLGGGAATDLSDGPEELADFQERLAQALAEGDEEQLERLAREGIGRFGPMRGRAPGLSTYSAYTTLHRINAQALVDRVVAGVLDGVSDREVRDPAVRRVVQQRVDAFTRLAEADARRRIAEQKGADQMARHAVRPSIENIDFTSARKSDIAEMRRQIHPLARRLATRLTREQHARRRGPLDFRRTVRASMSTGGVPIETRHKPRRPGRMELVVLCDVSGSVASFAQFTLMLVFALREQFSRVRAFTFVDDIHEVTDYFSVGADPVQVMLEIAKSAEHASRWGRTNYGRALERFYQEHRDALDPRTSLLVLGDARSNYSDLALPTLAKMVHDARHAWWLNPEHARHWDTGDSAAGRFAELVPMVECRNLTQLGEFVHDIVG